ncbi:uncharacterized protein LOC115624274 [Scaptodrosophila lebanonensis]|uniref:Uncharacterized protein LOC115624274 n=1 Tax=Drosophila lebanonensis TaxID=7225 RepID=A0A6J2TH36_DROLE|nr:uncharacterized protein LOC115624274 [Scaptodrosophila lebanonensis]
MKIGSAHRPLDKCIQYSCVKKGVINAKICPLAAAKQNCTIIEDVTQPFPKCCATLEC